MNTNINNQKKPSWSNMNTLSVMQNSGSRVPIDISRKPKPKGEVFIIAERCKECFLCIEFCPKKVLELSDEFNKKGYKPPRVAKEKEHDCIACHFCEDLCPELAIFIKEKVVGNKQ